jgi:hypothetical protein
MELETSEVLFGVPLHTLVLIICVVFVAWFLTKRVESFMGRTSMFYEDEYIQEIKTMVSYIGPYVGEIYLYLRAQYHSAPTMRTGPMFKPASEEDPTLTDPLLPLARTQIKSWIDSAKLRLEKKYPQKFIDTMRHKWDLSYKQETNGILRITHVENGVTNAYLV